MRVIIVSFCLCCLFSSITICSIAAERDTPIINHAVLLNNQYQTIPLKSLQNRKIASIAPLGKDFLPFREMLNRYAEVDTFSVSATAANYRVLDEELKFYNTLIFSCSAADLRNRRLLQFILSQAIGKQVVLAVFGNGSILNALEFAHFPIVWNPELTVESTKNAAMSIFGGMAFYSRLQQSFSPKYALGGGHITTQIRLEYADASSLGIDQQRMTHAIDAILEEAIRERATPGAVVMVAKSGKVIFEKAYGHHTYERETATGATDIFDMASVTKIAATTPMIMQLTEQGVVNLDSTMGHYLVQAQATNKENTLLRDVMLHEAGFTPYIPFYRDLKPDDLSSDSSADYSVKVADGCYIRTGYYESVMWPTMLESKLNATGSYTYSDISMYVMKEVAEHQTSFPIEEYVLTELYQPLGMKTAGYNPRERFEKERIVPTEYDKTFRKVLLQGYVHDQGAAMAGGIAGHAGLFASANDLAIYGQLLLNRGEYGGEWYFQPETVDLFTSKQSLSSRRGLGFDRADPDESKDYPSKFASEATFGHTGYTGTCIWVDPLEQLVYIFLSNRVHPEVSSKLSNLNIRSRVQDAVYEAIASAKGD